MVAAMLLLTGCQVRHQRWRALILSALLAAGLLLLVACSAYLPLFFFNLAWFVPPGGAAKGRTSRDVGSARECPAQAHCFTSSVTLPLPSVLQ
jgi:hypothetical protein